MNKLHELLDMIRKVKQTNQYDCKIVIQLSPSDRAYFTSIGDCSIVNEILKRNTLFWYRLDVSPKYVEMKVVVDEKSI